MKRRLLATGALLAAAAAVFGVGLVLSLRGLDWADKVGSVLSALLALVAIVVPALGRITALVRRTEPTSVQSRTNARSELAQALSQALREDDRARRTHDPRPLRVRWESSDISAEGDYDDIADAFLRVPNRRLVILGPAGAGKTALAIRLGRDLLASREQTDPVPVVLNASTWRRDDNVPSWIEGELIRNFPHLAAMTTTPKGTVSMARVLAESDVLPIIDGLDELPDRLRVRAIADLNAYGSENMLVMTSRPEEYEAAIARYGRTLSRASVFNVLPLTIREVKSYVLEATAQVPKGRWNDVFVELEKSPPTPLAEVLTNPLNLWLARTIYEAPESSPSNLLACASSKSEAEAHLLEHFLSAAYRDKSDEDVERSERFLRHLAGRMRNTDPPIQEISWWHPEQWSNMALLNALGHVRTLLTSGLVAFAILWIVELFRNDPDAAMRRTVGALDGGSLGIHLYPLVRDVLTRIEPTFPGTTETLYYLTPPTVVGFAAWTLALLGVLELRQRSSFVRKPKRTRVGIVMMAWRTVSTFAFAAVAYGILHFATTLDTPAVSTGFLSLAAAFIVAISVASRVDLDLLDTPNVADSVSPVASLAADRQSTMLVKLIQRTAVAFAIGLLVGPVVGGAFLVGSLALIGVRRVIGSTRADASATERYVAGRFATWVSGLGPWPVLTFLTDARERGVLRQSGATYRFRHITLLEYLGNEAKGPVASWAKQLTDERIGRGKEFLGKMAKQYARGGPLGHEDLTLVRDENGQIRYEDRRVDRWPRPVSDGSGSYLALTSVVFDEHRRVLGETPRPAMCVCVGMLVPLIGVKRARGLLARFARPLEWPPPITSFDDEHGVAPSLPNSPPELPGQPIRRGEPVLGRARTHRYFMLRPLLGLAFSTSAVVWLVSRTLDGASLFEAAGLLVGGVLVLKYLVECRSDASGDLLITGQRVVGREGFITHRIEELPAASLSYVTCSQSVLGEALAFGTIGLEIHPGALLSKFSTSPLGRVLHYGQWEFQFGADFFMLRSVPWVSSPVATYAVLVNLIDEQHGLARVIRQDEPLVAD